MVGKGIRATRLGPCMTIWAVDGFGGFIRLPVDSVRIAKRAGDA